MSLDLWPFLLAWLLSLAVAVLAVPLLSARRSVERWVARFMGDAGTAILRDILEPVINPILDEWWGPKREGLLCDMEDTIKILVPQIISGAMGNFAKSVAKDNPIARDFQKEFEDAPWWQQLGMKTVLDRFGGLNGPLTGRTPPSRGSAKPGVGLKAGVEGAGLR